MRIKLASSYNPGDKDAGRNYDYATILELRWRPLRAQIEVALVLGFVSEGVFVRGRETPTVIRIRDRPRLGRTDYSDLDLDTFVPSVVQKLGELDPKFAGVIE